MQNVKECLDDFLESESPGVVAIKGDWGAGKTYFVTNYLKDRHQLREKLVSFVCATRGVCSFYQTSTPNVCRAGRFRPSSARLRAILWSGLTVRQASSR